MSLEQRLSEAFHSADDYQPSPDLFARVERSLVEDRAHRRRVITIASGGVLSALFVVLFMGAFVTRVGTGSIIVPRWTLELLETLILVGLTVLLGPSIRRFGRNYVDDIFHMGPGTGRRILGLLDGAYYLVFAGIILTTASLSQLGVTISLQGGLAETVDRFGLFFMAMGVLHASTLAALPVVGLIFSSTTWRSNRARLGPGAPPPSKGAVKTEAIVKTLLILIAVLAVLALTTVGPGVTGLLFGQ